MPNLHIMARSFMRPWVLPASKAHLHVSTIRQNCRVYDSIRNENDFYTALMTSTTANMPLITYWSASYCPPCRKIKPLLQELLLQGNEKGWNFQYVEVEMDAPQPDMSELTLRHQITSLPTLLPFFRGEPCDNQRLTDTSAMSDRQQLTAWLEDVSKIKGRGSSSYGFLMSLFGG